MDEQRSQKSSGSVAISMEGDFGNKPSSSQHQALQLVEQQDNYITERAETMETIESTIVELGNIFQQLATMVKEQEEQVMRLVTKMISLVERFFCLQRLYAEHTNGVHDLLGLGHFDVESSDPNINSLLQA